MPSSRLRTVAVALAVVPLAAPALPALAQTASPSDVVRIEVLSGRGDLVTGGDALLRVLLPAGASGDGLRVDDDGRDVTSAFRARDGALDGLVTGLSAGKNVITAVLPDGRGARITLTDAPLGGPVFSGPQIQPWTCGNGSTASDCSKDPVVTWFYKSTNPAAGGVPITIAGSSVNSGLQPYDPQSPPSDVATTTTDDGRQVPFIVRQETGYSLRDQYRIAALYDPATQPATPDPTADNPGFAHKLVLTHGASCDTSYASGDAPDVLYADALGQGFAVASHALDNAGHNCNLVTQAESLIVTKELVAERFGALEYTIGSGCSGGSLVQQQVANAYPGVYQGIIPQCSFTDAWSSAQQYVDFVGLRAYLEGPGLADGITPAQWPSIYGHLNPANAIDFTEVIPNSGDPSRTCPGVDDADVYDPSANPDGVRCSLQDYMVNVFGRIESGPDAGKARRPISNVGIQYGLSGLLAYLKSDLSDPTRPPLSPAQFVALNTQVGGYDLDFEHTAERTQADPVAQDRVYRSGAVDTAAHLDQVAIIDLGGPEPGAFHDVYRKYSMRDRLVREHGTSDNQVFWEGQTPLLGDPTFVDAAIRKMDEWVAAIQADTSSTPLPQKIINAKQTAGVARRCTSAPGVDAPIALCEQTVGATLYSSPRIEAGGGDPVVGFTDDRLDCETTPLEQFDYAGKSFAEVFDATQQAALKAAYPTGVCDYSKPGKGFRAAATWLTYQDAAGNVVYGGTPMAAPPVSVPFGPTGTPGTASGTAGASRGGAPTVASATRQLAATGGTPAAAALGLALLGAAVVLRRRTSSRRSGV